MWTKLGISSLLIGFFIAVFDVISGFMKKEGFWVDLTLSRIAGDYTDTIVTAVPVDVVQNVLEKLMVDVPFWGVVVGLGVVFLVLATLMKEHK